MKSLTTLSPMSIPFPVDEVRVRNPNNNKGQPLDINDPISYRPRANGTNINLILQQAIHSGWMTKHKAPTFSFMKNVKPRFIVLVDRMLYSFKSETPEAYREFFELTPTTNAYVTDQMSGVLFCIEIKKKGYDDAWYLQSDDAETMKVWLDRIKRTISCLRENNTSTIITRSDLLNITTEAEEYTLVANSRLYESPSSSKSELSLLDTANYHLLQQQQQQLLDSPVSSILYENESAPGLSDYSLEPIQQQRKRSQQRVSATSSTTRSTYSLSTVPPPQLPPPKTQPPPIPSNAAYL